MSGPYTIPNLLTGLRIGLIPVIVVLFYLPYHWSDMASGLLFAVVGITRWGSRSDHFAAQQASNAAFLSASLMVVHFVWHFSQQKPTLVPAYSTTGLSALRASFETGHMLQQAPFGPAALLVEAQLAKANRETVATNAVRRFFMADGSCAGARAAGNRRGAFPRSAYAP